MLLQELEDRKLVTMPRWLAENTHYLCLMGSVAYGCSSDTSDEDLYGFAIPKKEVVFPFNLTGAIYGFDSVQGFEQWQQHHVMVPDWGKQFDFQIFSILKYFRLCVDGNPNCIDAIFVPQNCVKHITNIGQMVRDNRKLFLSKACFAKFRGYAFSQLAKVEFKNHKGLDDLIKFEIDHGIPHTMPVKVVVDEINARQNFKNADEVLAKLSQADLMDYHAQYAAVVGNSKRAERVKIEGTDRKFLYHVIRLALECEQILTMQDLDLQRDREIMKAVRRGDMGEGEVKQWFADKEKALEKMYADSTLPWECDRRAVKNLLVQCLEAHYGSLDKMGFVQPDAAVQALREIQMVVEKNSALLR